MFYNQTRVYSTVQPMSFAFAPPTAFQSCWYYSFYNQIQQQQLLEFQAYFLSLDKDRSGRISSIELQYLVVGGTPLGLDTATKLIKVFDSNRNGQIDFYEYAALHSFVNFLYGRFVMNDRNLSGTIDAHEVYNCLVQAGFVLSLQTVQLYFLKFSPLGYGLLFTQFLGLCSSIALTRSLFEWNDLMRTGVVHLTLSQLLDITAII